MMVLLFFVFLVSVGGALSAVCEEDALKMMMEMEETLDLQVLAQTHPDIKLGAILPVLLELLDRWSELGVLRQLTLASNVKARLKKTQEMCLIKNEL